MVCLNGRGAEYLRFENSNILPGCMPNTIVNNTIATCLFEYTGGIVPFGFDVIENEGKKFLKEDEAQTTAITEILELRNEGLLIKR